MRVIEFVPDVVLTQTVHSVLVYFSSDPTTSSETKNPELSRILTNKPKYIIANKQDLCNLRFMVLELVIASGEQDNGCHVIFCRADYFLYRKTLKISWKFKFMHWTDPKLFLTESHSLDVLSACLLKPTRWQFWSKFLETAFSFIAENLANVYPSVQIGTLHIQVLWLSR